MYSVTTPSVVLMVSAGLPITSDLWFDGSVISRLWRCEQTKCTMQINNAIKHWFSELTIFYLAKTFVCRLCDKFQLQMHGLNLNRINLHDCCFTQWKWRNLSSQTV
jgi:hypothetical protein